MTDIFSEQDDPLTISDPVIAGEIPLRRALGAFDLTMIGIGSVVGAGIFIVAGTAAAEHAGPAVILSFLIASLAVSWPGFAMPNSLP